MPLNKYVSFRVLPASWGLRGNAYAEAEAHYLLSGEELERRLIEIRCGDDVKVKERQLLDLDYKHHSIDEYHYDTKLIEFQHEDLDERHMAQLEVEVKHGRLSAYEADEIRMKAKHLEGAEKELAQLELDFKYERIEKNAYAKQKATLKNEPWISFIDSGFDLEQGLDGVYFELDWNPQWVEFLRQHGFVGKTDDQVVDDWFSEVCRSYTQTGTTALSIIPASEYPMGYDNRVDF